jgi:hypothetical protein
MCEMCARELSRMARDAEPLPDRQGDGRAYFVLREAAEKISLIVSDDRSIMLRYQNRCLKMATTLYAFIHGKTPDGVVVSYGEAVDEAAKILKGEV